jgi:hypothetical protein
MSGDSKSANCLAQLLVTEAIREFGRRFDGTNDKWTHVEKHICQLGRKPGFAMTSQLLRSGQESIYSLEDIVKFLTSKLSAQAFGVQATRGEIYSNPRAIAIHYTDKLPSWFYSVVAPGAQSLLPEQKTWFRCYAYFMIGVFSGALVHFGFRVICHDPDIRAGTQLLINFGLEELDGTWEFSASGQR